MKFDLNKIIEMFNSLNDQTRYAVLGGIVFLVIVLDVIFLMVPQISGIVDINHQITKMSQDSQQVLVDRQRINQLKKNLEISRLQFNNLNDKIRPIQEVPSILDTISSVANENSVKIDQLEPDKAHQEVLKSTPDAKYYALPLEIKAHCGYHMFGHFLNKLENGNMFFVMKDFIIQNGDKDVNSHSFSLTIKVILVDRGGSA